MINKDHIAKFLPFFGVLVFVFLWQGIIWIWSFPPYLVPPPKDVWQALVENQELFFQAVFSTATNALIGLGIAFCLAFFLSSAFTFSKLLSAMFLPIAVFFQTVPIISVAPLLVIWVGFGPPTVRAAAALASFFPLLAQMMSGLQSPTANLLDLFRVYKASFLAQFFKLRLPSAIPYILDGLRIGMGLAIIGSIVGEFIAGGGLGQLIDSARTQQRTDLVFAAVLLASVLGFALILMINLAEKISFVWLGKANGK